MDQDAAVKAVVSSGNDLSVHQYAKTHIGNNKVFQLSIHAVVAKI